MIRKAMLLSILIPRPFAVEIGNAMASGRFDSPYFGVL
jgi:hypothetical protein